MLSVDVVVNRAVWITWAVSYRVVVVLRVMNLVLNSVASAESISMTTVDAVCVETEVKNSVAVRARVSMIVDTLVIVK